MSKFTKKAPRVGLLLIVFFLLASPAAGQEIRATLFAEGGRPDGRRPDASVRMYFPPRAGARPWRRYGSAEKKLSVGKNLDDIRKDLDEAEGYFRTAIKATELAKVTMAQYLKARDDAAMVDAAHNAPELWTQGEAKFAEAGRKLEEGNINDARKKGAESEALFRDAELSAIKTSFFDETRKLLERAESGKGREVCSGHLGPGSFPSGRGRGCSQ